MKISTFILSFCGFCIFYITNADWIDDLIDDYLGTDYEEAAPFISSVTAGTEEFDQLVEEFARSKSKWFVFPLALLALLAALASSVLLHRRAFAFRAGGVAKAGAQLVTKFCCLRTSADKEEIQNLVSEFLDKKLKSLCGSKRGDDVPVKLLWKGGTLVESSIHCSVRESPGIQHLQKRLLRSRLVFKTGDAGGGDKKAELGPSPSEESTARRMADIRRLLENEQEIIQRFVDKGAGTDDGESRKPGTESRRCETESSATSPSHDSRRKKEASAESSKSSESKADGSEVPESGPRERTDEDGVPDPKLMNRIRLLESRLRLEELKNKNWIDRMSRAEGILQQLNKQVERIEGRPLETLTETLKITSTVTNWSPSSNPQRNMQFTLVNRYQPFSLPTPFTSLSEVIKREVGLSSFASESRSPPLCRMPPTTRTQIPALPSPATTPHHSYFLSKFLSR